MDKLLHWSIANAQGDKEAAAKAGAPDPKLLQQLFGGGPDEPALMRDAMAVIMNPEATVDNKLVAFDNFEMLIENLDNANNIENMRLWAPLISILESEEEQLRECALSVVGTAVQNNEKSQSNFLKHDGAMKKIIELARKDSESEQVRTKAFYALSNIVRHNKDASALFVDNGGLEIMAPVLKHQNTGEKMKIRALALLTSVLTSLSADEKFSDRIREDKILEASLEHLAPSANPYLIDRVLNLLVLMKGSGAKFDTDELSKIRKSFASLYPVKDQLNEDDYNAVKEMLG
ncbi:ADL319Wp [Eremothecium gossypii ATCC 10895]|uniref:Hsp70 nucleotide exchange factor FES1 n=1 Tax=Eremothecium gossypii (strain ATCC 10895 / CBS 109.51 / FGSC 9923 / NRRL Y-1056) TaxID=284811 RepID=FES1_EREGS|nr:ADL319Wp [Eremothecium gossypii ATCC 10895]Q75B89.1 RecName: Full=Hsp70 nucleotide exchange factor FES1 [Eremothecium gossypii ATCC 10895]AAS51601.1 ADL319Wp [Eremothecium gossypii ATCC 10895]AEY95897.1 FADL319Wp [Eremothecium gossypii FDAG1]